MCVECRLDLSRVGKVLFWAVSVASFVFLGLVLSAGYCFSRPPQCTLPPQRMKQCTLPERINSCGKAHCDCGCEDGKPCRCASLKSKKVRKAYRKGCCSGACSCGCNQGAPCECSSTKVSYTTVPMYTPSYTAPCCSIPVQMTRVPLNVVGIDSTRFQTGSWGGCAPPPMTFRSAPMSPQAPAMAFRPAPMMQPMSRPMPMMGFGGGGPRPMMGGGGGGGMRGGC